MSEFLRVLGYGLGVGLMIVGGVELIRWLCFRFCRGSGRMGSMVLLVRPSGPEDCEALVRAAAMRVDWMDLKPPCRLVCVDPGGEAGEILRRMEKSCHSLELVKAEVLDEVLNGKEWKEGK